MRKITFYIFILALICRPNALNARESKAVIEEIESLEKVVVKGVFTGPDLWKVTHGENVMWILGTLSPLPKRMKWDTYHIDDVISRSEVLLLPPTMKADLGFFQSLSLATTAIGIKKNPDKQLLKDRLPGDLYARWLVLKEKYIGNSQRIEKNRPIIAVHQLYEKALKKSGLDETPKVNKKIKKLAKKHRVKINIPTLEVELNEPKTALKKLKKTAISDMSCFDQRLTRLEEDLDAMKTRAVAWAEGDIGTLKALPIPKDNEVCGAVFLNSDFAEQLGLQDIRSKLYNLWFDEAKKSLESNTTTFAVMPISNLLGEDSLLNELEAMGFQIRAPKD